jgi:hypothetical protein
MCPPERALVEEPYQLRRRAFLLERAAPGDVASVTRFDLGQQSAARL